MPAVSSARHHAGPAPHDAVHHQNRDDALDHLWQRQRPGMKAEDPRREGLRQERPGELVDRDGRLRVERAVEECLPALGHALHGDRVEGGEAGIGDIPGIEQRATAANPSNVGRAHEGWPCGDRHSARRPRLESATGSPHPDGASGSARTKDTRGTSVKDDFIVCHCPLRGRPAAVRGIPTGSGQQTGSRQWKPAAAGPEKSIKMVTQGDVDGTSPSHRPGFRISGQSARAAAASHWSRTAAALVRRGAASWSRAAPHQGPERRRILVPSGAASWSRAVPHRDAGLPAGLRWRQGPDRLDCHITPSALASG